jgi:hypothetical protein
MSRPILPGILIIVFITSFSASCQKGGAKAASGTSAEAMPPASSQAASQAEARPPEAAAETPTTASMLAGDWVSVEDPSEGLSISDSTFSYTKGGEITDEGSYLIADSALSSKDGATDPQGKYITVFGEGSPLSYYIVKLDADALSLSYVGRGNTLSFSRPDLSRALGPLMGREYDSGG